jgi:hypothetical protein
MVDRSAPQPGGNAAATPVLLCCARGEADALGELVRALEQRGHVVELIDGVELDTRALAAAIERRSGTGLYVLVRSGALDREKVDALREVLLAHRLPFGRTLTVSGTKTADLLERIEQSLRRQVATAPATRPGVASSAAPREATGGSRRATVMVTAPTSAGASKPTPPRAAVPRASTVGSTSPRPLPPRPSADPDAATASSSLAPVVTDAAPPSSTPTLPGGSAATASASDAATDVAGPEDQTRSFAVSEDVAPGQALVGEFHSVVSRLPEPDTSATAMEIDADLLEDASIHPLHRTDDDELPTGIDLAGVLDGIGADAIDRTVPNMRTNTVVAPVVAFEGYPDDDIELSLRDGVIVDGYDRLDVTQVARAPAPPPAPAVLPRAAPRTSTVVAAAIEEEGSRWRYVAAAVVAALGLGIFAAVMVNDDEDDPPDTVVAAAGTDVKAVAGVDAKADADAKAKPKAKADVDTKTDAKADAKADVDVNADVNADADPDPDADADAKAGASATTGVDTKPELDADAKVADGEPLALAAKPAPPVPETTRGSGVGTVAARKRERDQPIPPARTVVLAALRARTIRALDVLLVTRRASAPMAPAAAQGHCDALELDGLARWRLPEIGELASLTDAGLIGRGFYWSSTAGDTFGDSYMAWNGGKRQGGVRYKNAAVICVRGDRIDGA